MREFVRAVQMKRKAKKLNVKEKILLTVGSDNKSLERLKGMEKEIIPGVGAGKIVWDKDATPDFEAVFNGKTIRFGFKKM